MRGVVVYESMYGNTHLVADAIGDGLAESAQSDGVLVVPVDRAEPAMLEGADLIVVGGPTHVHGMSRASTRKGAVEAAAKPGSEVTLDPGAGDTGLREWFEVLGTVRGAAAAFDTRVDAPATLTGRAAKGIARMLRRHGLDLVTEPESFLVDKHNQLLPGEEVRARAWGALLASTLAAPASR